MEKTRYAYEQAAYDKGYKVIAGCDEAGRGPMAGPLTVAACVFPRVTEFQTLNEAVLRSIERSEALYEQQKLFIGNASHEMQTPLAVCRNRLEMLMEDETLTEKQLEELAKTHQTLENLTRMNKALLMLCKIENHQFVDVRSLCLNELMAHYLETYSEVYGYKQIRVKIEEQGRFYTDMSESLAMVLVTNLLKNAFVHSDEGGEIRISFTDSVFSISNEGGEALDAGRIFERFYQGPATPTMSATRSRASALRPRPFSFNSKLVLVS